MQGDNASSHNRSASRGEKAQVSSNRQDQVSSTRSFPVDAVARAGVPPMRSGAPPQCVRASPQCVPPMSRDTNGHTTAQYPPSRVGRRSTESIIHLPHLPENDHLKPEGREGSRTPRTNRMTTTTTTTATTTSSNDKNATTTAAAPHTSRKAPSLADVQRPVPMRKNPRIGEGMFDKEAVERLLKYSGGRKQKPVVNLRPSSRPPRIVEATTDVLKRASVRIHLSKTAFSEESEAKWTRDRVMRGEEHFCRSWALVAGDRSVLGACTLRINSFSESCRFKGLQWAQVMNISAQPEGHGYGSIMFEQIESVLKAVGIFLVVLYPADNIAAPKFWGKMGFKERGGKTGRPSLLPPEECVNGKLIQECDVSTGLSLPRWEKDLNARTLPRRACSEASA